MTKYTLSLLEYVSRWPKPRATDSVTSKEMENFVFEQILCKFGVPLELVIDSGPEFKGNFVINLINDLEIVHKRVTSYHPQRNGLVEGFNKTVQKLYSSWWICIHGIGKKN